MFYQPQHERLKNLILCYWFIKTEGIPDDTKMLPDGFSDIMLNMGMPYTITYAGQPPETITGNIVCGQRTKPIFLSQPGSVNMIGIRLRPGAEHAFTGVPASEMVNTFLRLEDIAGDRYNDITQRLDTVNLPDTDAIGAVEDLLLLLLNNTGVQTSDVTDKAVTQVLTCKGNINIEELISGLGISYKQAERHFKKHIGLSPKLFARLHRFYHAFTLVRAIPKANWMQVLHTCGYYDQSHFIKDFSYFSGVTPTRQFSDKNTLDEYFGFR